MPQIRCPHCGREFEPTQSDYADIARQVRDKEFSRELDARTALMEREREGAVSLAKAEAARSSEAALASRDKTIAELRSQLARAADAAALASAKAKAELSERLSERDQRIAQLEQSAKAAGELAASEREAAVVSATAEASNTITRLKGDLERARVEREQAEATLRQQMLEQASYKDQTIRDRDEEIERLKNQRSRLSTKLVGESLEQHCETQFRSWRATALTGGDTTIEFHKDNDVIEGHKGDYIYRECDADGVELVSIMFEMKNEEPGSEARNRKTNESFLPRLDKNRTSHNCEYAVLVSMLEPESDYYNQGIVDVSWEYPKMYVIRPQFFVPMITLLRNAALNALSARRELAEVRQQNIDVSKFEERFDDFKRGFGKNYETASRRFQAAIDEIDKTIAHLEKVKANLTTSENQLRLANEKAQELTIRKLTYKNPTMRRKFQEAREARAQATPDVAGNLEQDTPNDKQDE